MIVSPLSLLKNPMILLAVVGLALVVGMPYMIDSSTHIDLCFGHAHGILTVRSGSRNAGRI